MVAIIPAAGKGTRMSTLTKGAPKELLSLGHGTVLGRVVLEALAAAESVVIVNSRRKPSIDAFVETLHNPLVKIAYQDEPRGLLDAICQANVQGESMVLLGDTVYRGHSPLKRLGSIVQRGIDGAIAVEPIATDLMGSRVIVEVNPSGTITRLVEHACSLDTSSRWGVAARFAFSNRLMEFLRDRCACLASENHGEMEIRLVDGLNAAVEARFEIMAIALEPDQDCVDCGSMVDYRAACAIHWD